MYTVVLFMPFIISIVSLLLGTVLPHAVAVNIILGFMTFTLFLTFIIFYEVVLNKSLCYLDLGNWINVDLFQINWTFLFDSLTVFVLLVVSIISVLVLFYSADYMHNDPHLVRFLGYICLFTFFMFLLITAGNFCQLFIGWEGVGLCSYLLVNFWYVRLVASKSAMKAIIINKIGDISLILAIILLFFLFKTVDFTLIFGLIQFIADDVTFSIANINCSIVTLICILIFIGAIGKSAQIGLHMWLPDAMEGPTPVSALIHAATMVTAGVFVIVRTSALFEHSPTALLLLAFIGSITSFFGSTVGVVQYDLKKIVAYSTCSQLGYMIFACGVSMYSVSLFHLFNHAFFKALLFLSAGLIIHAVNNEQDIRHYGGLATVLPFAFVIFSLGSLALMGFPFFSGFYSKDFLIEIVFQKYTLDGLVAHTMAITASIFTIVYSLRVLYIMFIMPPQQSVIGLKNIHTKTPPKMFIALFSLSILTIFAGYFMQDMLLGTGTDCLDNTVIPTIDYSYLSEAYNNEEDLWFEFYELDIAKQMELIYYTLNPSFNTVYSINTDLYVILTNKHTFVSDKSFDEFDLFCSIVLDVLPYFCSIVMFYFCHIEFRLLKSFIAFLRLQPQVDKVFGLIKKWYFDLLNTAVILKESLKTSFQVFFKLFDRGFFELFGPYYLKSCVQEINKKFSGFHTGNINHYLLFFVLSIVLILFSIICYKYSHRIFLYIVIVIQIVVVTNLNEMIYKNK